MLSAARRLFRSTDGVSAIEYALLLGVGAIIAVGSAKGLGFQVNEIMGTSATQLTTKECSTADCTVAAPVYPGSSTEWMKAALNSSEMNWNGWGYGGVPITYATAEEALAGFNARNYAFNSGSHSYSSANCIVGTHACGVPFPDGMLLMKNRDNPRLVQVLRSCMPTSGCPAGATSMLINASTTTTFAQMGDLALYQSLQTANGGSGVTVTGVQYMNSNGGLLGGTGQLVQGQ